MSEDRFRRRCARAALHDADLLGEPIAAGTLVVTFLGAANRDPLRYEEPETFDIGRTDTHPLSFGSGIHHCLGAELARVEGQIVFERLLARFPRMGLVHDRAAWRPSLTLRGLAEVQVEVTSA